MKLRCRMIVLWALASMLVSPAAAQVEQVTIRTTGISCGVCAAVSEINFKRMPGIGEVRISLSQETIVLSYKAGSTFDPQQIRQVLQPLEVVALLLRVRARGLVHDENGKRFFLAGKNRFLVQTENATPVPLDTPIVAEGITNEQPDSVNLKILTFKVIDHEATKCP